MSESRRARQFHVVQAWEGSRYAFESRPGARDRTTARGADSEPRTLVELIDARYMPSAAPSSPALPHAALSASSATPVDVRALLARRWLAAPAPSAPVSLPSAVGPTDAAPPIPAAPDPTPVEERRPSFVAPAPRRTRPWICPACRLNNAPWSKACTGCRSPAPPLLG